jgi:predicted RNA-binding Zn-ribbon protein involved in translation (DUF1610 family)
MKTKNNVIRKISLSSSIAIALAIGIWLPVGASAQASRYSSKPWLPMTKLETQDDFKRLPNDAQIAMACAKCKSVVIAVKRDLATKSGHGTVEQLMTVDQCPGCGGKMIARSDKQTEMVHTCSKCGDDSAFCCATTKAVKQTKGMEKK